VQVGIFDADVYGPSLPTMVSPELRILRMNPDTRAITPTEYEGVQLVSFGFAGQGSAIMRGAMVSGLIQQMLTTTEWGEARWWAECRAGCRDFLCTGLLVS
jgi:Mrp family chromosome partitioning ATPase